VTLVLVHGVPEVPAVWEPLRECLTRDDTVALQLPGFGCQLPLLDVADACDFGQSAQRSREVAQRAGASTVDLDGLGHWWMLQDPARVAPIPEEFLAG
jgi:hypothetical protein